MKERQRISVSHSGAASAPDGYANSGVHLGDVNLVTGAPVRTRYRLQVERIAPACLVARDQELAELADFCTSPTTEGAYGWWRAEAWSGKTALLSWFVLHPPTGVRIISFFVTARLAGQNNRPAFIDNVLEQLLAVMGEGVPPYLTESNREAHVLGLLSDAAEVCRRRGEQLVLVVDGLDEDRSVDVGADAHSIAALLPVRPPGGMRIIVTGRPNPPLAADVPQQHPLRIGAIVRTLTVSGHAQAIRVDMEREIRHLMQGTPLERDLLGFVTAAGGGLSATDLAELTGESRWEVEDNLRAVIGRSFSRRDSRYQPGTSENYLLGHEELHATALQMLGRARLEEYRRRIHAWADSYQSRGWPTGTSEYLLSKYVDLLAAIGEPARMVKFATDLARQDRMLDLSGGDAAILAEINAARDLALRHEEIDLSSVVLLAMHVDNLQTRNLSIPIDLPQAWAKLGNFARAENLARSLTSSFISPHAKVFSLRAIAYVAADIGNIDLAANFLDAAADQGSPASEFLIPSDRFKSPYLISDEEGAEALFGKISRIVDPGHRAQALRDFARSIIDRNDDAQLLALADSYSDREPAWAVHGDVLSGLAFLLARAGHLERSRVLIRHAEDFARSSAMLAEHTLCQVVPAIAVLDGMENAVQLVDSFRHPLVRVRGLTDLAHAAIAIGRDDCARSLIEMAETTARLLGGNRTAIVQIPALLATAAMTAGYVELGRALAGRAEYEVLQFNHIYQDDLRGPVAESLATVGSIDRAVALMNSMDSCYAKESAMCALSAAYLLVDNSRSAEEYARSISRLNLRARSLASLALYCANNGESARALSLAGEVENSLVEVPKVDDRLKIVVPLVGVMRATGCSDRVDYLLRQTMIVPAEEESDNYIYMLAAMIEIASADGNLGRVQALAEEIEAQLDSSRTETIHCLKNSDRLRVLAIAAKALGGRRGDILMASAFGVVHWICLLDSVAAIRPGDLPKFVYEWIKFMDRWASNIEREASGSLSWLVHLIAEESP